MVDYITIFYGIDVVLIVVFVVILYFVYQAYRQRNSKRSSQNVKAPVKQIPARPDVLRLDAGSTRNTPKVDDKAGLYLEELMERNNSALIEKVSAPAPAPAPTPAPKPEPLSAPVYLTDLVKHQAPEVPASPAVETTDSSHEAQSAVSVKPEETTSSPEVKSPVIAKPAEATIPPAPDNTPLAPNNDRRCCANCDYYQPMENLENMGTCKNFTCKKFNKTVQAPNLSCERYGDSFVPRSSVPASDR